MQTDNKKNTTAASNKNTPKRVVQKTKNYQYRPKRESKSADLDRVGTTVVLGLATDKPESHMTPLEKMAVAEIGVSKKDLERLKNKANLDYERLAQALLVTRATLINKKGKAKFNRGLSERIVGLADIYSYGYDVFGNEERFNRWMSSPNQALGGRSPYELVNSQFGREEIRNMIGRIDYGVYS
jgi:putative toxin-antitoxin system antitoxin component (TIGR02293 family)